jgi:hypothetical protein
MLSGKFSIINITSCKNNAISLYSRQPIPAERMMMMRLGLAYIRLEFPYAVHCGYRMLLLIYFLTYSPTLKMEVSHSSEMFGSFPTRWRCKREGSKRLYICWISTEDFSVDGLTNLCQLMICLSLILRLEGQMVEQTNWNVWKRRLKQTWLAY